MKENGRMKRKASSGWNANEGESGNPKRRMESMDIKMVF